MRSSKSVPISGDGDMSSQFPSRRIRMLLIGIGMVLMIIIFALSIATLSKVNRGPDHGPDDHHTDTTISPTTAPNNPTLVTSIRVEDALAHLNELQRIASASGGTRAINTPGFNGTLDYITNYLTANTNYHQSRSYFFVKDFALASDPILVSSINGVIKNYIYSTNLSVADFYYVKYSAPITSSGFVGLTAILNFGCTDDDWEKANPSPENRVALVKRGSCTFSDKAVLAAKYNVTALLLYNDGTSPDRSLPIAVGLAENNTVPALFLSFPVGEALVSAAQDTSRNAGVELVIEVKDVPPFPVGNICADTPTGDVTQTIVIGSHSDSVPAGPGINDNGKFTCFLCFICFSSSYDR